MCNMIYNNFRDADIYYENSNICICKNVDFITLINLVIGLGSRMTWGKNLVVDYREMIVSHKQLIRCMVPVVAMRQIAVALLIDITVARYKQISSGAKDRPYAATDYVKSNYLENAVAERSSETLKIATMLTPGDSRSRMIFSRCRTSSAVRLGCLST